MRFPELSSITTSGSPQSPQRMALRICAGLRGAGAPHSPRHTGLVIVASLLFLAILIGITASDYVSRGGLDNPGT